MGWKVVGCILFLFALMGWLWAGGLYNRYHGMLPRQPDAVAGRIYPLNAHGIVVYQTREERDRLNEVLYSPIGLGVASGLMAAIYQKKFSRARNPWEVGRDGRHGS